MQTAMAGVGDACCNQNDSPSHAKRWLTLSSKNLQKYARISDN
jgi:hypothetical protein